MTPDEINHHLLNLTRSRLQDQYRRALSVFSKDSWKPMGILPVRTPVWKATTSYGSISLWAHHNKGTSYELIAYIETENSKTGRTLFAFDDSVSVSVRYPLRTLLLLYLEKTLMRATESTVYDVQEVTELALIATVSAEQEEGEKVLPALLDRALRMLLPFFREQAQKNPDAEAVSLLPEIRRRCDQEYREVDAYYADLAFVGVQKFILEWCKSVPPVTMHTMSAAAFLLLHAYGVQASPNIGLPAWPQAT